MTQASFCLLRCRSSHDLMAAEQSQCWFWEPGLPERRDQLSICDNKKDFGLRSLMLRVRNVVPVLKNRSTYRTHLHAEDCRTFLYVRDLYSTPPFLDSSDDCLACVSRPDDGHTRTDGRRRGTLQTVDDHARTSSYH